MHISRTLVEMTLTQAQTCGEDTIGVGKASEDGTRAKGEKAKGIRVVLMLKVG